MRKPHYDMSIFKERREKLGQLTEGAALVFAAHPHYIRNNDVAHPYRQDTNFFYLTGFEEPEAVFVFRPGQKPETVMFVSPKDPDKETWDGFRYGVKGVIDEFGMDAAYEIQDLENQMPELLKAADKVYYQMYNHREMDLKMDSILRSVKERAGRSGRGLLTIEDTRPLLGEMRIRKSDFEIETLRKACQVGAEAHIELMKAVRPGMNEREIHGIFIKEIMSRGAQREGYGTIVAGGNNANTLHYVFNDQVLQEGDLLLVDAGSECNYYTSDITRTYPVNGHFTSTQKRLYESLLSLQKKVVEAVRPGISMLQLQDIAVDGLVDIMLDEKVLKGSKEKNISEMSYKKFYPHGIGHWLGSDVHDAGLREINGEPRLLEPHMCLTIEPGLYIPQDTQAVPDEIRGIGIRIEDNILVTETGQENLTASCPKEVADLEAIIG